MSPQDIAHTIDGIRDLVHSLEGLGFEISGCAAMLASILPNPKQGPLVKLRKILDMAAFNFGHAANAVEPINVEK